MTVMDRIIAESVAERGEVGVIFDESRHTEDELIAEIKKWTKEAEAGKGIPMEEAFSQLEAEFGIKIPRYNHGTRAGVN